MGLGPWRLPHPHHVQPVPFPLGPLLNLNLGQFLHGTPLLSSLSNVLPAWVPEPRIAVRVAACLCFLSNPAVAYQPAGFLAGLLGGSGLYIRRELFGLAVHDAVGFQFLPP